MRFTAVFVTAAVAIAEANVAAARVLGQPAVARAAVKNDVCLTSIPNVCGTNVECVTIPDANPLGICVDSDAAGLPIPGLSSILCNSNADCAQGSACDDPATAIVSLLSTVGIPGLGAVTNLVGLFTNLLLSTIPVPVPDLKVCVPNLSGILSGLPL